MSETRKRLQANIDKLIAALEDGQYPKLQECLYKYNGSLLKRLMNIYRYTLDVLEGRSEAKGVWCEYHKSYEVMAALDVLVSTYKGSKETWRNSIQQLAFLGLIQKHKPSNSPEYNTPEQLVSVARAEDKGHQNAVTWYSLPAYTDIVLINAELNAPYARQVKGKDSTRDLLGSTEANRIDHSTYGIHPETVERRQLFRETLAALVDQNGYAYAEAVVTAVKGVYDDLHNPYPVDSEAWEKVHRLNNRRVKQTWEEYKHTLYFELGMVYRKPTEQERELYGLVTYKYIICRADQSGTDDISGECWY